MQTSLIKDPDALSAMTQDELAVQVLLRRDPSAEVNQRGLFQHYDDHWFVHSNEFTGNLEHYLDCCVDIFDLLDEIQSAANVEYVELIWSKPFPPPQCYQIEVTTDGDDDASRFTFHEDRLCCIVIAWISVFDKGMLPKPEANNA